MAPADASTGDLTAEPLWSEGNRVTLDNLNSYPTMKANGDVAALIFTLNDGAGTKYIVSGNATSSSETVSIDNPFIKTEAQALAAARLILSTYGGNVLDLTGGAIRPPRSGTWRRCGWTRVRPPRRG